MNGLPFIRSGPIRVHQPLGVHRISQQYLALPGGEIVNCYKELGAVIWTVDENMTKCRYGSSCLCCVNIFSIRITDPFHTQHTVRLGVFPWIDTVITGLHIWQQLDLDA